MSLQDKFRSADEAVSFIKHNDTLGISGFTLAGDPKATGRALARRARAEHAAGREFQVGLVSGASTGQSVDGELAQADAISWRTPFQSNKYLRAAINSGKTRFFDMHLSLVPQYARYGFLGKFQWAVVEAADIDEQGRIIPTTSIGASPTFCRIADKVIVELNRFHPKELRGLHDIYELENPPHRQPIPLTDCASRIGTPYIQVDPSKIAAIIETDEPDEIPDFTPTNEATRQIGVNVAEFLAAERKVGRIPQEFLPLQSGIGNVANAVLGALGEHPDIPNFEMFTEVIQDSVISLIRSGKIKFATGTSLRVSPSMLKEIYADLEFYKSRILLRPQEITNHPEMIRRLGVITINTALELDIFGNVNSTHVMGRNMMNGIGGSGDFTRNAYISIFTCPSLAKGGAISPIVPIITHVDNNEHSVQVVITEQGIADLRGKSPTERAHLIINNCAHPAYRDELNEFLTFVARGHTPTTLSRAFAMHEKFIETGTMHGVEWGAASLV